MASNRYQSQQHDVQQYFDNHLTQMFGIKHPIFLAGMNVASGPKLAAAVINSGGLGVIGGMNYTPGMLRDMIKDLKSELINKDAPFGVDLLLPQVGKGARKTNYDYTKGHLDELINVIIEEKAKLFVSAIGVPPKHVIDKLHSHGILVMNMVGAPRHAVKAINLGVDILCAQGGEGGGHTGDIGTAVLIPAIVDICHDHLLTKRIPVLAAGGIYDGRGLAMALCMGASGVWVGTRFVASVEADAPDKHKKAIIQTKHDGTMKTLAYTGRPLRIGRIEYAIDWETGRRAKMEKLLKEGIVPADYDKDRLEKGDFEPDDIEYVTKYAKARPYPHLMGQVAGSIYDIKPASAIMADIVTGAARILDEIKTLRVDRPRYVDILNPDNIPNILDPPKSKL